ncbi:hypothetical protein [Niabella beijingensis]|uniref:hypothetical protein n=1 Tax=Niabella beijingensis TaxID=2872700 RepID=UPI001CBEAF13|nr:hypothetical protein [Niabella beijingensis]MBZ4192314.1 hypothetical protein [Niabella beijingensis]
MKQPFITGTLLIVFMLCSCGFEERRKQLDERERAINAREQAVMLKEKEIRLAEDSLKRYAEKMDSASRILAEQVLPLPDSLAGSWNVTMVCSQTNCSGFAVGDIRKENWLLSGNGSTVGVRAMQGDKLIRVYTGSFTGTGLKLSTPETEASQPSATMQVTLKIDNVNKMSGQRLIIQADGCETTFKVDMDRSKNQ